MPTKLFETFRNETPLAAAITAVDAVAAGVAPQSVWDGVFIGAGELLMRQPGIIGLHGLTTANAMHYLWQNVADETLRKQLLLQACSFNSMFLESAQGRGKLGDQLIESLQPAALENAEEALPYILSEISSNRQKAAEKVYGFLSAGGRSHDFVNAARQTLFVKGGNAHDYKFSSAVLKITDT